MSVGGEIIAQRANVTENGGIVKIYLPDFEANRWRAYGWMRYQKRQEIGDTIRYVGTPSGARLPVTWNVTLNPCRSCK